MTALGTVFTVLRAGTGLDGQERADLHFIRVEMLTMDALSPEHQVIEWQFEQRTGFLHGPIVAR